MSRYFVSSHFASQKLTTTNDVTNDIQQPSYSVVAYITAYQDLAALSRCIQAIKAQSYPIQRIVVVDNSPIPLSLKDSLDVLQWSHPTNIGISGGLRKLIAWTTCQTYDFVWMFDQDSQPAPDCLDQLIQAYARLAKKYPVGIVAPLPVDPRTQYVVPPGCFMHDRFEGIEIAPATQAQPCDSPITSGSLLWLKTVDSVAPPDVRLFIDGIDLDYGWRLKQAGYQNFVIPKAVMSHNFGYPTEVRFLGKKKVFQAYSALRYYYIARNHTYLELKFSKGRYKLTCALRRLKFVVAQTVWLSIADTDCKIQKIWACLAGTYNGFLGNLDQQFRGSSLYPIMTEYKKGGNAND